MQSLFLTPKVANSLLTEVPLVSLSVKITSSLIIKLNKQMIKNHITAEHCVVICLLNNGSAFFPNQLSESMNVSKPHMTKLLDKLEALNLVTRKLNVKDRRKFIITLSNKGKALANRIEKSITNTDLVEEAELTEEEYLIYKRFI